MKVASLAATLAVGAAFAFVLASACAVDLPARPEPDGGRDGGPLADGGDSGGPKIGACTTDVECQSSSACVTSHCENATGGVLEGSCAFDQCPTDACSAAACDSNQTCGAPQPYGFHATAFPMKGRPACYDCVAYVAPFLFVATSTLDVQVYSVADPTNPAPPAIAFPRLPFTPTRLSVSGRRLVILGRATGVTGHDRTALAWLDVPSDPGLRTLPAAEIATLPYPFMATSTGDIDSTGLYAVPDHQILLTQRTLALLVDVPPPESATPLAAFPSGAMPADAIFFGASGKRLLTYRVTAGVAGFGIEADVGTANAQNTGEQIASAFTGFGTLTSATVGVGPDGSAGFATTFAQVGGPGGCTNTLFQTDTRFTWVLNDAAAVTYDFTSPITVETYATPVCADRGLYSRFTMANHDAAIVLTQAHEDINTVSVTAVVRSPAAAAPPGRRFILPTGDPASPALASGSDNTRAKAPIAFAILPTNEPDSSMVHVFAPACGGP